MGPFAQRLRVATSSLLGMTKGSPSFRARLGGSASPTPGEDGAPNASTSSSAGTAKGDNARKDGTDEGGDGDDEVAASGAADASSALGRLKSKTASKLKDGTGKSDSTKTAKKGLPHGAAYPGAPDDLMEQLGFSANKDSKPGIYPTLFDPATRRRTGVLQIEPHKNSLHRDAFGLWYEQHGNGDTKILFVMGLQSSCFSWLDSVVYYGSDPRYSCVVLDNRGFANSDAPYGRYRTSCMAWDCLLLLDELGWTAQRSVHVVGVSMGGMITLELAKIAPERFASIMLVSTTSGQGWGEKSLLTSLPPPAGWRRWESSWVAAASEWGRARAPRPSWRCCSRKSGSRSSMDRTPTAAPTARYYKRSYNGARHSQGKHRFTAVPPKLVRSSRIE